MKILKTLGLTLLGAVIVFVLIIIIGFVQLYRSMLPDIRSDSQFDVSEVQKCSQLLSEIQDQANNFSSIGKISDDAHDLYTASNNFLFPNIYIAFCLDDKERCEAFFVDNRIDLSKFKKGNLSEHPWNTYTLPNKWPKRYQDKNWPLTEQDEFLGFSDMDFLCLYTPKDSRIYLRLRTAP